MRFGLLLPHFGKYAHRETLLDRAADIEALGFDSVWVRDHLIYSPHGFEGDNRTFLEPLLTLSAISGVTRRLKLGTAVLVPIRWPIKLAQNLATLDFLAPGRVIAGMGLGNTRMDFEATGLHLEHREDILRESVEIARQLWSEDHVSFKGDIFEFEDVTLSPKPEEPIPFFYGGTTKAAVRRAVSMMDGWIPGRIPLATLDARLAYLKLLAGQAGKTMMLGTIPLVVADRDRYRARDGIDIEGLGASSAGAKYWLMPSSGQFRTVDDFEGLLIAGDRDDCRREVDKLAARDLDLVVFDLRLQFHRFWEQVELLSDWVLADFDS